MINRLAGSIFFAVAAPALSSTSVNAKDRITCPSLVKAAELAKMKATHFSGDDWEIETKDESVFFVSVSYEDCASGFKENLSKFILDLNEAGDEWITAYKLQKLIESDGQVFLKHHVILPFG